ncbi:MAG: c-type cytochrome, partial [Planctomycetales bacterium]|nr:c-type cytochrome [Planctomycetales bacterium]
MPATEQTWRNQKTLHVVFGLSSLAMLIATIWMFAKDHAREWKDYQATQLRIDQFFLTGRMSEAQTAKFHQQVGQAQQALVEAQGRAFDSGKLAEFKQLASETHADVAPSDAYWQDFDSQVELVARLAAEVDAAAKNAKAAIVTANKAQAKASAGAGKANAAELSQQAQEAQQQADDASREWLAAVEPVAKARDQLAGKIRDVISKAKVVEDNLARAKKFANADLTAATSLRDIAVGNEDTAKAEQLQAKVERLKQRVAEIGDQLDTAVAQRKGMDAILKGDGGLLADQLAAEKRLTDARADLQRMKAGLESTGKKVGRAVLGIPVLDAFDNSDSRIDQLWLPDLTINYNFSDVSRFDRCITCHRAIDKTMPGSATDAAYPHQGKAFTVLMSTPKSQPALPESNGVVDWDQSLRDIYGLELANEGLLSPNEVVVSAVLPESPAAMAGLELGDVIKSVSGGSVLTRDEAISGLIGTVSWGQALELTVQRGLPHPFASHPRLDLFLGSLSPHKIGEMGCTICHDGQGSATAFKWASHTPNTPLEANQWREEHGWFDNHHWIFPMYPERFIESGCLKCHHSVTELEPSDRFPEPPAPKLMQGYDLVRKNGCFGCHEINGYAGPDKTIGPDLRTEPNYFAVAHTLLVDEQGLNEDERRWAEHLVSQPEDDVIRRKLFTAIKTDLERKVGKRTDGKSRMSDLAHGLGDQLKDVETPGKYRRPGPSLRFVASKSDFAFLYNWIMDPTDFRPSTRMPRFFGQWEHLPSGDVAERYEPLEVRAISEYLLSVSKEFQYLQMPNGYEPSAERGAKLFETRGCLACHSRKGFDGIAQEHGPELSEIAAKFDPARNPNGAQWLYSWIRKPSRYHFRTKMPDLFLDPVQDADGTWSDPAADIAAYLLSGESQWKPQHSPNRGSLTGQEQKDLYDLAFEHLAKQYAPAKAEEYLKNGIPESMAAMVKGDDITLLGQTVDENRTDKLLAYVGRRSVAKYGCSGCHDIPGYEAAKPIGTGLADWGRKNPAQLAFEQIGLFLAEEHHGGHGHDAHEGESSEPHGGTPARPRANDLKAEDYEDPDTGFFLEAIGHHNRQGFAWQKLRQPRSYDFEKVENKGYNERLRMPKFSFSAEEREAVMTFVLGLVSEPPAAKYIYTPDPRQEAILAGQHLIEEFNCAGCHTLRPDRWDIRYHADDYDELQAPPDYPFLSPYFTPSEVAKSLETDQRGMLHATLHGRPDMDPRNGEPRVFDSEGDPISEEDLDAVPAEFNSFVLWEPALINGQARDVGSPNLMVRLSNVDKHAAWGGALADYLFPVVLRDAVERGEPDKGQEAWGWVPPPLMDQGRKAQTPWMADFLKEPYRIRPAVVLRMPKFNFSRVQAEAIAEYFAAYDNTEYPLDLTSAPQTPSTAGETAPFT